MPDKFKNGGFTLKARQMFSVHTTSPVRLDLCQWVQLGEENHVITVTSSFFGPHDNEIIFNPSSVKRFWTIGKRRYINVLLLLLLVGMRPESIEWFSQSCLQIKQLRKNLHSQVMLEFYLFSNQVPSNAQVMGLNPIEAPNFFVQSGFFAIA